MMALPEPDLNRHLITQERKIVARTHFYLSKEYEYLKSLNPTGDLSPLADIRKRTAEACGVTQESVDECVQEFKEDFKNVTHPAFKPKKGVRKPNTVATDDVEKS